MVSLIGKHSGDSAPARSDLNNRLSGLDARRIYDAC
jgi:hypothetical protein